MTGPVVTLKPGVKKRLTEEMRELEACSVCKKWKATRECDWHTGTKRCAANLCDRCTSAVIDFPELDLCPAHAKDRRDLDAYIEEKSKGTP